LLSVNNAADIQKKNPPEAAIKAKYISFVPNVEFFAHDRGFKCFVLECTSRAVWWVSGWVWWTWGTTRIEAKVLCKEKLSGQACLNAEAKRRLAEAGE